jgi:outer membrane protein
MDRLNARHASRRALSLAGTFAAALLASAAAAGSAAAQGPRLGFVNLPKVFDEYQRTKDSEAALEGRGKQRQSQLEGQLNKLKELRAGMEVLTDQAREGKARQLEEEADKFKRLRTQTERELLQTRNQVAKQIFEEIQAVVTEYAKANGFALVLDQRGVLYGEEAHDLTEEVLRILNERYAARRQQKKAP